MPQECDGEREGELLCGDDQELDLAPAKLQRLGCLGRTVPSWRRQADLEEGASHRREARGGSTKARGQCGRGEAGSRTGVHVF